MSHFIPFTKIIEIPKETINNALNPYFQYLPEILDPVSEMPKLQAILDSIAQEIEYVANPEKSKNVFGRLLNLVVNIIGNSKEKIFNPFLIEIKLKDLFFQEKLNKILPVLETTVTK